MLVLFDNHTNQSTAKSYTVGPGLGTINSILNNSGINAIINVVAYDKLPTTLCGGGSNPCYSSYTSLLNDITASKDVLNLRLKHGADAAIVLRSTMYGDLNYQTAGIANRTDPGDPFQADKTYAVVYALAGKNSFAHEIGHLLGAGHSNCFKRLPLFWKSPVTNRGVIFVKTGIQRLIHF